MLLTTELDINEAFRDYYRNLYSALPGASIHTPREFFATLHLMHLQRAELGTPLQLGEIRTAISQIATGKTPPGH